MQELLCFMNCLLAKWLLKYRKVYSSLSLLDHPKFANFFAIVVIEALEHLDAHRVKVLFLHSTRIDCTKSNKVSVVRIFLILLTISEENVNRVGQ